MYSSICIWRTTKSNGSLTIDVDNYGIQDILNISFHLKALGFPAELDAQC